MPAPGSRIGAMAAADPGTLHTLNAAAIADALARVVTREQLEEAVAIATAAVTTDGLAADDLSNVDPEVGRARLGLGALATKSVGELIADAAVRTTYARPQGDLSGQAEAPTVARIQGVAVSGTPEPGWVLTATSATSAVWAPPTGGGGGGGSVIGGGLAIPFTIGA